MTRIRKRERKSAPREGREESKRRDETWLTFSEVVIEKESHDERFHSLKDPSRKQEGQSKLSRRTDTLLRRKREETHILPQLQLPTTNPVEIDGSFLGRLLPLPLLPSLDDGKRSSSESSNEISQGGHGDAAVLVVHILRDFAAA